MCKLHMIPYPQNDCSIIFVKHINTFDKEHSKPHTSGYVLNKLSQLQTFLRPWSSSKAINVPTKKIIE